MQGPCATIDTACSAGLAAVNMAMLQLRAHACDVALAMA
jgi:acyl transferase domain-containing protein